MIIRNQPQVPIVDAMLKLRCASDGSYHKPVKQLVSKVPAIDFGRLIADIHISLYFLGFNTYFIFYIIPCP